VASYKAPRQLDDSYVKGKGIQAQTTSTVGKFVVPSGDKIESGGREKSSNRHHPYAPLRQIAVGDCTADKLNSNDLPQYTAIH
jgi:hypothetical protein